MAKWIPSESEREKLEQFFADGAILVPSEAEYWVHDADEGLSYCHDCCEKEVKRLLKKNPDGEYCVDGGWGTDGDSTPFCETCGKLLENTLTDYGCEAELDHFTMYGFDIESNDDRRAMSQVISGREWEPFAGHVYRDDYEKKSDLEYYEQLYAVCKPILGQRMAADFILQRSEVIEPVDMPAWGQVYCNGGLMLHWLWETYYQEPMCFTFKIVGILKGKWSEVRNG